MRTMKWITWAGFVAAGTVWGALMATDLPEWAGALIGAIATGAVMWVLIRPNAK